MFFYPTALAEPGLHQFGKQLFLKSAESRFPKTAETDFSDFCRNKITIYTLGHHLGYCFVDRTYLTIYFLKRRSLRYNYRVEYLGEF